MADIKSVDVFMPEGEGVRLLSYTTRDAGGRHGAEQVLNIFYNGPMLIITVSDTTTITYSGVPFCFELIKDPESGKEETN
jgi:hypothetical protein